jgi:hypothetical protein
MLVDRPQKRALRPRDHAAGRHGGAHLDRKKIGRAGFQLSVLRRTLSRQHKAS